MYEEMKNLAERYHAGQFRGGVDGNVPYIEHPRAVVRQLLNWGEPEESDAAAMAWGHDLLEDTAVSDAELLKASNARVLDGIVLLTRVRYGDRGPKRPKRDYLRAVAASGSRDCLLVKVSDRLANARDFARGEGPRRGFLYLHDADCVFAALCALPADPAVKNAMAAWQELDDRLRPGARREMIRGCLLGGAVGDALGSPVEFLDKKSICELFGEKGITGYAEFRDGTGAVTDDTQMTLFTAEGILRACVRSRERGVCDPVSVMRFAYWRWLKTQGGRVPETNFQEALTSGWLIREKQLFSDRAPGRTCITALEAGGHAEKAFNKSKGCGTVMRMAPAGLFFEPERAYEYGCKFSALTHGHPTGITSGGAFAMLISLLAAGKSLGDALDRLLNFLDGRPDAAETAAALRKARTADDIAELGQGWVAEEALAVGVFCALKHTWDFKSGVLEAVNITGDSDSTGSVAGNILGVMNGESGIPAHWRENLREYRIVSQTADDLWTGCEEDADGGVTPEWWAKYPGF